MQLTTLFSTAIQLSALKDKALNKKLENYAYHLQKTTTTKKISNQEGFQSKGVDLTTPLIKSLFDLCLPSIRKYVDAYDVDYTYSINVHNLWFNINPTHAYNTQHIHGGSDFSAVYYIKAPAKSGSLVLVNPDPSKEFVRFFTHPFKTWNKINHLSYRLDPNDRDFIIFPSHIPHYVSHNKSKENRISLSFNLSIEKTSS